MWSKLKWGVLSFFLLTTLFVSGKQYTSPNGKIALLYAKNADGRHSFAVSYTNKQQRHEILTISSMGITLRDGGEIESEMKEVAAPRRIDDNYAMLAGKRMNCSNQAVEYVFRLSGESGREQKVVFRLYDDGVAFRYILNGLNETVIKDELTTYCIPEGSKRWMQKYNASYEDFFPVTTTGEADSRHWGYPALIQRGDDVWALISEAGIEKIHSASSLKNEFSASYYKVCPAENKKAITGDWESPWRVLIVGSLSDVVESTLITDVSTPCCLDGIDWIRPGSVSWVYWAYNHGSKDFRIVKQYIDMAAEMELPYVLIDWEWDVMGNGGTIDDALQYAAERNVRTLLWYNSSTAWTTHGAGGPLFKLNAPEDREEEFAMLEKKGVAGVKIDFFSGDTQETMEYCIRLLECAADHHLMVNFHGATVPRGWQRTYPNLMSVEAVYGAEWYNNAPILTNRAAAHNTTLPFTRNVIGSMDYTPCTFSDSQHQHITSHAHELALTVVFESALQHLADSPESYLQQPESVKTFMSQLPATWDDTRLVSGYPGDHIILARKKGERWYVGILNGTDEERTLDMDWSFVEKGEYKIHLFEDSGAKDEPWHIKSIRATADRFPAEIHCRPRGGAVIVMEKL